jgi:putative ABC transport system permease protein
MTPPRLPTRLLQRWLPAESVEAVLGDLTEGYEDIATKEGSRRANAWFWRETLLLLLARRRLSSADSYDLIQATRLLVRRPGFTMLAVLTLALGLGSAVGVFSIVHGVLLKPLPYPEPDRLVRVYETAPPAQGGGLRSIAIPTLATWKRDLGAFDGVALYGPSSFEVAGDRPAIVDGAVVSASFFSVLGIAPAVGRGFSVEEDRPGGDRLVVLGHKLWRERFGGLPNVVGQSIRLDREPFTVIGVMPRGFEYPRGAELYVSIATDHEYDAVAARHMGAVGRLRPGHDLTSATADLLRVERQLASQDPAHYAEFGIQVIPLQERLVGDARPALRLLAGAVALVLLITCVNVANLMLARAARRRREIALRLALGARRGRVARQLLVEALLVFGLAAVGGLGLAALIVRAAHSLGSDVLPRAAAIQLDGTVLLFALLLTAATGLITGLLPALQGSATTPRAALNDGTRGTGGPRAERARAMLIVAETGLTAMLLVGAGLMLRSMQRLNDVDPGFQPARLLTFGLALPSGTRQEPQAAVRYFEQVKERLAAVPGVQAIAFTSRLPLSGEDHSNTFHLPGEEAGTNRSAQDRAVSPGYFGAMGIPVIRGREFGANDRVGSPPVVLVNASFAKRYFPGVDPVGMMMRPTRAGNVEREIVGVVGDSRQFAIDLEAEPEFYLVHAQDPWPFMQFAVRTARDPRLELRAIEDAVWSLDPEMPLARVRTMEEMSADGAARRRIAAICLSAFALMANLLAAIGLYSVISHAVTQRTSEFGIRMALGASAGGIARLVLSRGVRLVGLGAGLGLAAAIPLSTGLRGMLYGVTRTDPATYALIALLLPMVGVLAGLMPAWRAMRIDPITAMREE